MRGARKRCVSVGFTRFSTVDSQMDIVHPNDEAGRLKALRDLSIVGTDKLPEFDALVEAAAAIFDCPIGLVSLVEETEQWFKACCGLNVDGTPRDISFCQHTILSDELFIVQDALKDERFRENPLVTRDPGIRFYAGCPLSIDGQHNLGALCVIDREPRTPSPAQLEQLRRLAKVVEGLIRSHLYSVRAASTLLEIENQRANAARQSDLLEEIANVSGVGGWELDLKTQELTWTTKTCEIHELPLAYEPTVDAALSFYAPEKRQLITDLVEAGMVNGCGWDAELPFITAENRHIWVRAAGRPVTEDGEIVRLIGAIQDISERKEIEQKTKLSEAIHRTTLETLTEGVLLLDKDGTIQSSNPAAARLLGYSGDALTGERVQDLEIEFRPGIKSGAEDYNPLAIAVSQPDQIQNLVAGCSRRSETGLLWLKLNAVAIAHDDEFGLDGVVVSLTDVTETKRQADTLQVIFDNFPGGVVHYDENLLLSSCNEEFQKLLKIPTSLINRKPHLLEHLRINARRGDYGPGDPEELAQTRLADLAGGSPYSYERTSSNGVVLEIRGTPISGGGIVASVCDVTQRKKTEQQLVENARIAKERSSELEVVLASMRQGVSVFDRDGRLRLWNDQYVEIFNKPDGEVVVGVTLRDLLVAEKLRGEFEDDVDDHLFDLTQRMGAGQVVRATFKHSTGKVISTIHAPLPDGGWIGTHEDVTLREQAAEKITYAAHHDTLTGLANRTLFNSKIEDALKSTRQQSSTSVLMLMDLDHFKPVNDTYGHDIGDALLMQVAERLNECVRSSDLVARLGGDEFGIILADPGNGKIAEIAKRLIAEIGRPFNLDGKIIQVSASMGVAPISPQDMDTSPVIKRADIALYQVKKNGRSGFRNYDGIVHATAGTA